MTPYRADVEFKYLKLEVPSGSPHVVVLSLNRPKKRNAISAAMWREIGVAFSILGTRGDDCRCVVLTGAGKAFSAGLDISDTSMLEGSMKSEDVDIARKGLSFFPKIREMQRCFSAVEECPIPVVAAIHGNCIGAGVDLAASCDVRLAEPGTKFSIRETKIGLAADVGTLQRLPKITGNDSRVRELCYTGETFDEHEALRIGFISRISSDSRRDAIQLADVIARNSPVAVAGTKRSLVFSRDHSVSEGLEHVATHNALALMTEDITTSFVANSSREVPVFPPIPAYSRL